VQQQSSTLFQKTKVICNTNTCFCSREAIASCKQVKIPSAAICCISSGSGYNREKEQKQRLDVFRKYD
jgi:hypothetical protein